MWGPSLSRNKMSSPTIKLCEIHIRPAATEQAFVILMTMASATPCCPATSTAPGRFKSKSKSESEGITAATMGGQSPPPTMGM